MLNQSIELEGLLTAVRLKGGLRICTLITGDAEFELVAREPLAIGTLVRATGVIEERDGRTQIMADKIEILSQQHAEMLTKRIEQKISNSVKLARIEMLAQDEVTEALRPKIEQAARQLIVAQRMGRYILIRFHNDADGIAGALALTTFLRCSAIPQKSAVYTPRDGLHDLGFFHHRWRPLLVLIDFGCNAESADGLKLLAGGGVEVVAIDHHPPSSRVFPLFSFLLNPWLLGAKADLSAYTAGYIACEIARLAGGNSTSADLARTALAGDRSSIIELTEKDRQTALVLDYIATYSSRGNSLEFYRSVLEKPELFSSVLLQANEKMAEIADVAKKTMKQRLVDDLSIILLDLEKISKKHEFPSKGKVATAVLEMFGAEKKLVVLGYGKRSIAIRISPGAAGSVITTDIIIAEVRQSMGDFIESAGGHARAAAVKVKPGFLKDVVGEIVRVIEKKVSAEKRS